MKDQPKIKPIDQPNKKGLGLSEALQANNPKDIKVVQTMSLVLEHPKGQWAKTSKGQHQYTGNGSYKQVTVKTPKNFPQQSGNFTPVKIVKHLSKSPLPRVKQKNVPWSTGHSKHLTNTESSSGSPSQQQPHSKFLVYDNSQQIFQIRESNQENMLFNQDKQGNPVNLLKNKFDIQSGTGTSNPNERSQIFGHTPIAGATITNHYYDKDGKPVTHSQMKILSNSDNKFELAPQQQHSRATNQLNSSTNSIETSPAKFEHIGILANPSKFPQNSDARAQKYKAQSPIKEQMFETSFTYAPQKASLTGIKGSKVNQVSQGLRTNADSFQQLTKNKGLDRPKKLIFDEQTPTMSVTNKQSLTSGSQQTSGIMNPMKTFQPIKRETKRGFGVHNRKNQAMIVFDQPLKAIGHHDLSMSTTKYAGDSSINMSSQDQREATLYHAFQQQMSQNVLNSRHDQIELRRQEKAIQAHAPKEYLNRHPAQIKKYRQDCKIVRKESQQMIINKQQTLAESLQPYLLMTPSQQSSVHDPNGGPFLIKGDILPGSSFEAKNTRKNQGNVINTGTTSHNDSEDPNRDSTFMPGFAHFNSDKVGKFTNKSSMAIHTQAARTQVMSPTNQSKLDPLNMDSSANLIAYHDQANQQKDDNDIQNRHKLITNIEQMSSAMFDLDNNMHTGLKMKAGEKAAMREEFFPVVKKNQSPFLVQKINQTSRTGFDDRETLQSGDLIVQKANTKQGSVISETDTRNKDNDTMTDTKQSFVYNKRISIEQQLEDEHKKITPSGTATKLLPSTIGNDKVSSTIFTYKDMRNVFKRQINRIKNSSSLREQNHTMDSTTSATQQHNSKSMLSPKVYQSAKKPAENIIDKHNLTMHIFEKTPRHHSLTVADNTTSRRKAPQIFPTKNQLQGQNLMMTTPISASQKFQYRPDLLNTLMANVNMGNLNAKPVEDEYHVPLGIVQSKASTEQERGAFRSINERQRNMIKKYNDNLQKSEWKELPFKVQKRQEAIANGGDNQESSMLPQIKQNSQMRPNLAQTLEQSDRVFVYGSPDHLKNQQQQLETELSIRKSTMSVDQSQLFERQSGKTTTPRKPIMPWAQLSQKAAQQHPSNFKQPSETSRLSRKLSRQYSSVQNGGDDYQRASMHDLEDTILEEEDLTLFQQFLIAEEETRQKYEISEDAQAMIEKIDMIIADKKEKQTAALVKLLLKTKQGATTKLKGMLQNQSETQSQMKGSVLGKSINARSSAQTSQGLKGVTIDMVAKEAKQAKVLPAVVQEVLAEQLAEQNGQDKPKPKCDCNVRETLKEYIRYIRHHTPDLSRLKERLQELKEGKVTPCAHEFEDDAQEERQLLMITWFEKFAEQFDEGRERKIKVKKPQMFKEFCKFVVQQEGVNSAMLKLQDFIKKNNLMKQMADYSSFASYNKFLALKLKKKSKLNKPVIQQFDLEDSHDSSVDSADEQPEPSLNFKLVKEMDREESEEEEKGSTLQLYNPNEKYADKKTDGIEDEINIGITKNITINKKMYQNFLGAIVGDKALENLKHETINYDKIEELKQLQVDHFQESLKTSLNHVMKTLKNLKKIVDDAAQQKERRKYMSTQNIKVIRKHDKHVDYVLAALEKNLGTDIGNREIIIDRERKNQELLSQVATPDGQENEQQTNYQELKNQIQAPIKAQKASIKRNPKDKRLAEGMRIYDEANQKQQFYQKAKRLIQHHTGPIHETNPILKSFIEHCQRRKIMPEPCFINLIKNNMLMIRGLHLSPEQIECLSDIIKQGEELKEPSMQIHKLLIDDAGLNDKSVSRILKALKGQEHLKSVTIMNCQMADSSVQELCELLNKPIPNDVQELRLHNIKCLGDLQSAKPEDDYKNRDHSREPLLATVLDLITQNTQICQLKTLQLSQMSLDNQIVIDHLWKIITSRDIDLTDLDLSFANVSLRGLGKITAAFLQQESEGIKTLTLKGVSQFSLTHQDKEWKDFVNVDQLAKYPEFEDKEYYIDCIKDPAQRQYFRKAFIMANLKEFLHKSTPLQHVDLSLLELKEELVELVSEARFNMNLIAMHLSGNHISYEVMEQICSLVSIDLKQIGPLAQNKQYVTEQAEEDQLQSIVQTQTDNMANNRKPFEKRKVSESVAQRDNYTELNNILQKEVRKGIHDQIQDMLHVKNCGPRARGGSLVTNQLVIFRKFLPIDEIFTDSIQNMSLRGFRPYDLSTLNQRWHVRVKDDDCYVCRKHKYMKIFYRRSDASKQYHKITKEEEVNQLMQDFNIKRLQNQNNDPYKKLPLIFGSVLGNDIPCRRMLQVQHQAALQWAQEHKTKIANNLTSSSLKVEPDFILRKFIKGIKEIMKANYSKVEKEDLKKINATFAAWREIVLPSEGSDPISPASDHIVNYPIFDPNRAMPDEDDIFIFSGFIPPGVHHITIYDPIDQNFYRMDNIAVFPREENIKGSSKTECIYNDDIQEEDREALQMQGDHYHYVRQQLYGDLYYDFSNRLGEFSCRNDLEPGFLDLRKQFPQAKQDKDLEAINQAIGESYAKFLKVYKILQIESFNPVKLQMLVQKSKFASFFSKILGQFQTFECIKLGDIDQTFEIINKSRKNPDADYKFNRRKFLGCILRIAQLLNERQNNGSIQKQPGAIKSIMSDCFGEFLKEADDINKDIHLLRKQNIFNNRPLSALLLGNLELIKLKIFNTFLTVESLKEKERIKRIEQAEGKKIGMFERYCNTQSSINQGAYGAKREFLLSESLPLFMKTMIAPIPELQSLNDLQVLVKLASQSQMTVINEQILDKKYRYLNFQEFLVFLVHCAVFWKLEWVNQDQPDEPGEEEVPVKKESKRSLMQRTQGRKQSKDETPIDQTNESTQEEDKPTLLLSRLSSKASHKNIARAMLSFFELLYQRIQQMQNQEEIDPQISLSEIPAPELHVPNFGLIIEKSVAFRSRQIKEEASRTHMGETSPPGQHSHAGALNKKKRAVESESSDYSEDSEMDLDDPKK